LGSTEVLHIYLSNQPGAVRLGTSGRRVPGYEVRLLDMEDQPVPKGETGNLWVRGDSTAPCYWNRADKTAETMRGEWIFTGDRFREDEEGNFHFDGRADDLIKVSGQWVYPMEIERCLAEHAAVHECAVRGVKDQRGLMTLHAHVCLRDGHAADDEMKKRLQDHAKSELVPYKYPRRVSFHANLPKTGTGKIDRQALKTDNT
jgi:acyl-coenzyme A synthetase/AMP-(fatty) acid ligase